MRSSLARLAAVSIICAALAPITGGTARAAGGADLAITATWVGRGIPRAGVGQTVTYAIKLTNLGPDASADTYLFPLTPDPFNPVSTTCSDDVFCSSPGGTLAVGQTVTATVVEVVCCFPVGESRTTNAGATVFSMADPNPDNDFASVPTRIVGPHGFFFPP